jgi:hypothetical protein
MTKNKYRSLKLRWLVWWSRYGAGKLRIHANGHITYTAVRDAFRAGYRIGRNSRG